MLACAGLCWPVLACVGLRWPVLAVAVAYARAGSWRPGRDDDPDRNITGSLSVSEKWLAGSSFNAQDKLDFLISISILNIPANRCPLFSHKTN